MVFRLFLEEDRQRKISWHVAQALSFNLFESHTCKCWINNAERQKCRKNFLISSKKKKKPQAETEEMFSLFWYVYIQRRCSPFCSREASTFSRILLNIFPVSSWPDLFVSKKNLKMSARQLQQDQRPSLGAINSQEQSKISTINPFTLPVLSYIKTLSRRHAKGQHQSHLPHKQENHG